MSTSKKETMMHIFGRWLIEISDELKSLVLLGAVAICWTLCLTRKAMIFKNKQTSLLQVIILVTVSHGQSFRGLLHRI